MAIGPPSLLGPSPSARQQARHPPLIRRLALTADARSAQRVLGGGDGLRRGRREGRLQSWSYPAHHGEKLLAAVRAEIGHTVGRSRIRYHFTPSFCGGRACCFSAFLWCGTWLVPLARHTGPRLGNRAARRPGGMTPVRL